MNSTVQWMVIITLVLLLYFLYVRDFNRYIRSNRATIGMTDNDVKRLIGNPNKVLNTGKTKIATYKFCYSNRLRSQTSIKMRIEFHNGKVKHIYKSVDK